MKFIMPSIWSSVVIQVASAQITLRSPIWVLNYPTQDEVCDPRQVLARPTWVADTWVGKKFGSRRNSPPMVGKKFGSRLPSGQWQLRSVRSGKYPYFGLFGLANTQIEPNNEITSEIVISLFPSISHLETMKTNLVRTANSAKTF